MSEPHGPIPAPEQSWLPVAEEPAPSGNITDCAILRNDGTSLVCEFSGDIDAHRHDSTGLYYRDTRYLSKLTFTLGGLTPSVLDETNDGCVLSAIFTNQRMAAPDGSEVDARALVVRRRRVMSGGMLETLTVSNYARRHIKIDLVLEFEADFRDIFEVRGYERRTVPNEPVAEAARDRVRFEYAGADGMTRTTRMAFSPAPTTLTTGRATFSLDLPPRADATVTVRVGAERLPLVENVPEAIGRVRHEQRAFLGAVTSIETDSDAMNALIERSLLDIRSLLTWHEQDEYVAAGVPWFDTLFGRDSLIAGMLLAPCSPGVLQASLRVLALHQAFAVEVERDAAPGKIPHELRWGELAQSGELPFGRYYGSVDATPLFLVAAMEYYRWTGDSLLVTELWPALQKAFQWCLDEIGEAPFLSYERKSAAGLENQGWKDSHDAVMWPDGRMAEPPIALVEVQGYFAAACAAFAELAKAVGEPDDRGAGELARAMVARIADGFGEPDLGYAYCIDGRGEAMPTPTSNPGHLLWCGAARRDRARTTAHRLMQDDLYSGWGVRTMGTGCAGFNPLGYHTGSVWPHDNAILVGGFRRYGLNDEAERLGSSILDAALSFPDYHLPELFSGDTRELRRVPTPYPVASRPQAWSAATIPYIFSVMLGLRPTPDGKLAIVNPDLPARLSQVAVSNLRCGGGSVDLVFRKNGPRTGVEIVDIHGDTEIVLLNAWPDALLAPEPP